MFKKILGVLLISFIGFSSTYSYELSNSDQSKGELIASKIESLIANKGEKVRTTYVKALKKLQDKYLNNVRLHSLIGYVTMKIDTSENGLENMFLEDNNIGSINSAENQDLKDLYTYRIANEGDYKVLYISKKYSKVETKVDSVDGEMNNIFFYKNFLIYDWVSTGGMVKKVFDITRMKEVRKMRGGKTTNDKKFIYSCEESGYGPGYVDFFNLSKGESMNLTTRAYVNISKADIDRIAIRKCSTLDQVNDSGGTLLFQLYNTSTKSGDIKIIHYDFNTNVLTTTPIPSDYYDN